MTNATAREVIAAELGLYLPPDQLPKADTILSALSAAGIETYDTRTHVLLDKDANHVGTFDPRTHVVVPREPTEAMARAGMAADFRDPMGAIVSADCYKHYRAMLAAAEKENKG